MPSRTAAAAAASRGERERERERLPDNGDLLKTAATATHCALGNGAFILVAPPHPPSPRGGGGGRRGGQVYGPRHNKRRCRPAVSTRRDSNDYKME